MLPDIEGREVCRSLRAGGSDLAIIMLTALRETPDMVAGLDAGADDYLTKPFSFDELLARVRAVLRRRSHKRGCDRAGDTESFGWVLHTSSHCSASDTTGDERAARTTWPNECRSFSGLRLG